MTSDDAAQDEDKRFLGAARDAAKAADACDGAAIDKYVAWSKAWAKATGEKYDEAAHRERLSRTLMAARERLSKGKR